MKQRFLGAMLAFYAIALAAGTTEAAEGDSRVAADGDTGVPSVVVEATAMPGAQIEIDKIPGNVQVLDAADLSRDGPASLTEALNSRLGSVNFNDDLDDPFQPDILYRGFEASPVLGTPQGLAVYQNGVRINEAFGDTVNWDLFPDIAIKRVEISSSSPVYGLNALGGGISITMKNGFDYQGEDLELSGGSFGQRSVVAQAGAGDDHFGAYVAGKFLDENGWRLFSNDALRQVYTALTARTDSGQLELNYTYADNHLNGQGSAPLQELNLSRGLVFTGPQDNDNRLNFPSLNGSLRLTDGWSAQGLIYYRQYQQTVANGNTTNYAACTDPPDSLCQADGATPVTNAAGAILPDISEGGTVPIGENDYETINAYGRGAALQTHVTQPIAAHGNQFTAGATVDYANMNYFTGAQVGVINAALLVLPSYLSVDTPESSPFGASPVSLRSITRVYGGYLTDTFDVTPKLSLTASARYNISAIDLEDKLGTNLTGNNRYTHLNPAAGAAYQVLPVLTAYIGVAQNLRTPTASEIECSNPSQPCLLPTNLAGDPPTLKQVVARTVEFGVRAKTAGLLVGGDVFSWNLSAFRTVSYDDIYGISTSLSSGFFQNIGSTRRQGIEAGLKYRSTRWDAYLNYSYVDATFRSPLTIPSPSNPFQDASGNIDVSAGDRLPGIPLHRVKIGADYTVRAAWIIGVTASFVSDQYYFGDESNQLAPMPTYHVVGLHTSYQAGKRLRLFASVSNLLNSKYSTFGILSDPTGIGAPGVPVNATTNGPGVDNRFQSPAAPFDIFGGVRITF